MRGGAQSTRCSYKNGAHGFDQRGKEVDSNGSSARVKKNATAMRLYQQTIAASTFAFARGLIVDNNLVTSGADALLTGNAGTAPVPMLYKQKLSVPPQDIRAGAL